jgi:hypothetical protein
MQHFTLPYVTPKMVQKKNLLNARDGDVWGLELQLK